jgi:enoyl-[acyl-carrier protein] reductase/trans-2-enoyl-CoA reductase (NAD+)
MKIEPRVRGFISLNAHPKGCERNVLNQINYIASKGSIDGPKNALVIGASTGFGLASRITAAIGSKASTIGIFFERPAATGKPGSAGWYNNAAFEAEAQQRGLYAKSINGDAFSDEIKQQTIELIKADLGKIDLIIYSLASPKRTNPRTGITHNSVLKPIGSTFSNKTVDFHTGIVSTVSIDPANEQEIADTVAVMGGEDWEMWMEALKDAGVLADGVLTIAYSYIGPALTESVYRKGTIGRAKDDLEKTAGDINQILKPVNGKAFVSVNKALVTQASSAIPVIPLYMSLLFKAMKADGSHEGCIEQIQRLFAERLYKGVPVPTDEQGRIRIDDWEMKDSIQNEVARLWNEASTESLAQLGDLEGYRKDFMRLFGFEVEGVNYEEDVNEVVATPGLVQKR